MTREEVIARLCKAIADGRDEASNWGTFPTDCFCTEHKFDHFTFDHEFMNALEKMVKTFTSTWRSN